ncbi:hypothetical protein COLO4_19990 [Corchorus olitorius]|uniref:RNase H type-1 domain-containing protein n=1 Tax=Corchorus olitorius TaxID=93759 RepID=A0A1R3J2E3_9ROSI|nr:hypothetical protein COLO4_19990 [Corchorus olitorius]
MVIRHFAWIPPSDDSWKLNYAGFVGPNGSGSGCVLRDQNAFFKAACARPLKDCKDLILAELDGLHQGLMLAISVKVRQIYEISNIAANTVAGIAAQFLSASEEISAAAFNDDADRLKLPQHYNKAHLKMHDKSKPQPQLAVMNSHKKMQYLTPDQIASLWN